MLVYLDISNYLVRAYKALFLFFLIMSFVLTVILFSHQPLDITVTVEPVFIDCCKPCPTMKIDLNVRAGLTCEAPWVVTPAHLVIMNLARVYVTVLRI